MTRDNVFGCMRYDSIFYFKSNSAQKIIQFN